MAEQGGNYELQPLMAKLFDAFQEEDDRELLHRKELTEIFDILNANKAKIRSQPPELEKKVEDLAKLLNEIDVALQGCKAWSERQRQQSPAAQSKKKMMPSVSDCNPFKSRSEPGHPQQDDASPPIPVEPLLRRTRDILCEAEVTTDFYEWTTSYFDETRIFGWEDEAKKVAEALVGDDEDGKEDEEQILFRAAGIAGIHGSGKTALAQKVFVHDKIKDAFPLRLWVCVGPPDCEDRAGLLYRMLDNLGVDTYKVEDIVDDSAVVKAAASENDKAQSKIGVLLYILHVTLHKTGHPYLIVFDDIRVQGDGAWYSNLTLQPPKDGVEWNERLAYGLPKARKSAVLVTCRREDDARAMVRTGSVFRPPQLRTDDGWKLFKREYEEAKTKKGKEKEDKLYKELEEMKEEIVDKCLGLPVAIVEAAKGFAVLDYELPPPEAKAAADETTAPTAAADETTAPTAAADETTAPTAAADEMTAPTAAADETTAPTAAADETTAPTAAADETTAPTSSTEPAAHQSSANE